LAEYGETLLRRAGSIFEPVMMSDWKIHQQLPDRGVVSAPKTG
jgi:hypothetical protein